MKFYHGTSLEKAHEILQKGFGRYTHDPVWLCSDEGHTYLWKADIEDDEGYGRSVVVFSATTAAAMYGSECKTVAIFTFDIPDIYFEEEVSPDQSCENMYGAYNTPSAWLNRNIVNGTIKMSINGVDAYVPGFRWHFLVGCSEVYINLDKDADYYVDIAKRCGEGVFTALMEDMDGLNWRPLDVSDVQKPDLLAKHLCEFGDEEDESSAPDEMAC